MVALRLARCDTGTPADHWLGIPVFDLPEWCSVVLEEQELLEKEAKRRRGR